VALLPLRTQFKGPAARDSQLALLMQTIALLKNFAMLNSFVFLIVVALHFVVPVVVFYTERMSLILPEFYVCC